MSLVGRNDPCPCGSGRKFKKCCLNKSGAASQSYRSGERDSALAKLMRFSARTEFKGAHEAALKLFWGDRLLEGPDEELKEVVGLEQVEIAYNSWFSFDFDLGDGRRPIDVFLQREGEKLSSGERNYLDRMPGSHLRLYEIIDVPCCSTTWVITREPGRRFTLPANTAGDWAPRFSAGSRKSSPIHGESSSTVRTGIFA